MLRTLWTLVGTALGVVLGLFTVEAAIRPYCSAPRQLDPRFGFVLAAGSTVHWHREGSGTGHWSAFGIRGSSLPAENRPKVLVLGDSLVEAVHVDDPECFTARLEARLAARGWDAAVLNAGVQGSSAPYYAAAGPAYLEAFSPAWTVIGLSADDLTSAAFVPRATHFTKETEGSLGVSALPPVGGGGWLRQGIRRLRARSALAQNAALQFVGYRATMASWRPFRSAEATDLAPVAVDPTAFPIEAELALLVDRFEGRVTFLFFSLYDETQPFSEGLVEAAVQEACARRGWSCVATRDTFSRFAGHPGAWPRGFPNTAPNRGHLNPAGHDAAAEALERELIRLFPSGL